MAKVTVLAPGPRRDEPIQGSPRIPPSVVGDIDGGELVAAVDAGVVGVVRRGEATPERLVRVIHAASVGEAAVPPDLLGRAVAYRGGAGRDRTSTTAVIVTTMDNPTLATNAAGMPATKKAGTELRAEMIRVPAMTREPMRFAVRHV